MSPHTGVTPAQTALDSDRPITSRDEDLLERGPLVDQLKSWVLQAPVQEGFVIGVTGPWGSGKTSVLQLLAEELDDEVVVARFDPWLFSRADQLVARFFDEIGGLLVTGKGKRIRKVGRRLADYGAALSPAAGVVLGPAGQLLSAPQQVAAMRQASAGEQRQRLREALLETPRRIVVLIDDIDRLDPREVGEVMRLVKLVADLPGVVHVLSYDRMRVQQALELSGHEDGRAYLEKIVQVSAAVPPVSRERLRQMTLGWLQAAVGDRPLVGWDQTAWGRLVDGGIDGYLATMRDGRRLCNVAGAALDLCVDEVASMDVLALEAVRVFDPDVHEHLLEGVDMLTAAQSPFDFRDRTQVDEEQRKYAEALLGMSNQPEAVRTILRELFPAAAHLFGGSRHAPEAQWREAKRVSAKPVLLRYLHLALATSEVASAVVDRAVAALADGKEFAELLAEVEDARLDDLLGRVRPRIGEQATPDAVNCALVVLDLIPRLTTHRHFFDVDPPRRAVWFVEDLVENVDAGAARQNVAHSIIEQAPSLSMRLTLLYRFRVPPQPSENPALDLLDATVFDELRETICQEVVGAEATQLAKETDLLWLIEEVREVAGKEAVLRRLADQPVLRGILSHAGTRVHPLSDGSVRLHLKPLIELGGEGIVPLLEQLVADADELEDGLRAALRQALTDRPADDDADVSDPADAGETA